MNAVVLEDLRKTYRDKVVLDGVSLSVPRGSVYGFLGSNGAGKTTTLRILLGLAHPSSGRAVVLGEDVHTAGPELRHRIGYAPDVPSFPSWQRADEFLRLCGSLFGLSGQVLDERVAVLLELAGLQGVSQPVKAYSRGMRQRLGISQALINAPEIVFLDEPTSALDPVGRHGVLEMLDRLRRVTTVFFSTHILVDVEQVCDRVAVLDRGRVVAEGSVAELTQMRGSIARYRTLVGTSDATSAPVTAGLVASLEALPWVTSCSILEDDSVMFTTDTPEIAETEFPRLVAYQGWRLGRFAPIQVTLEEAFMGLISPPDAPGEEPPLGFSPSPDVTLKNNIHGGQQ